MYLTTILTLTFATITFGSSTHKMPAEKKMKSMDSSSQKQIPKMEMKKTTKTSSRKSLSESSKKEIIAVLEANEALHTSFFKYEASKVAKSAKELNGKISLIKDMELSKLLKYSQTMLAKMVSKSTRDENNQNYHMVSMALIHIVNTYDIGDKYNSYSCPMVKKKWLQSAKNSSEVNNPYAPNMPHCGRKESNH